MYYYGLNPLSVLFSLQNGCKDAQQIENELKITIISFITITPGTILSPSKISYDRTIHS